MFLLEALGESLFPSLVQLLEIAGTLVRAPPCIFNLAVWHLHSLSDLPFCCHISSSDCDPASPLTGRPLWLHSCECARVLSHFSCVRLFVTPWTVARQAPLSMGFSRQEYWSGLPCPSPGDLPDPGIEPRSPALQADCLFTI